MKSLSEMIINLAETFPDKGIGYIQRDGSIRFFSFEQTYILALKILGGLHEKGMKQKDYILITLEKNEEIIPTFWACVLGGIIPSLLQPPLAYSNNKMPVVKLHRIWELMNHPPIIVSESNHQLFQHTNKESSQLIYYKDLTEYTASNFKKASNEDDIVYVQFSSGSTGNPKGIELTNQNVLTNIHDIAVAGSLKAESRSINWMPLYHDMGLVGFHLTLVYAQSMQYFIDTIDFIKNPSLWLDAISNLGIDTTGSPNFGQALTLRHLERKRNAEWDFSTISNFYNGAEPISADIMTRFIQSMEKHGFKETAMIPCYGMAEATLAVSMRNQVVAPTIKSFSRRDLYHRKIAVETNSSNDSVRLVGVGPVLGSNQVRVLDENGNLMQENQIGHIQIKGKNVSCTFYNKEFPENEMFDRGWLITGDMGFFHNEELFITGRSKDLIFIHGQNYYSHDLENIITNSKPELYGKIACCAVFDNSSKRDKLLLFVVGPSNKKFADQYIAIRNLFNSKLGLQPDEIIPVRSSEIPRTSSGKLQRYELVNAYQKGDFKDHPKF
jgi:acyl-CoA synthetase (AMP-forming)/AMP-acid ligase II